MILEDLFEPMLCLTSKICLKSTHKITILFKNSTCLMSFLT